MRHKTRHARVLTTFMAAAKDSDGGIDMAGPAAADAVYDEYGYGLRDAGRAVGPAWFARGSACLNRSANPGQAAQCRIYLYTCMFMMS